MESSGWGTICDDGWDIQDARVICRQLGYPDAVAAFSTYHDEGTGPIWLDNVQCLGTELDFFTCVHNGIGVHDCDYSEDASVECLGIQTMYYKCLSTYVHMFSIVYMHACDYVVSISRLINH